MKIMHAVLLIVTGSALAAGLPRSTAPAEARVYIISPQDGATVSSPVTVRFGLSDMGIAPAGVPMAGTGHHHLLIDVELPALDQPVPADEHRMSRGCPLRSCPKTIDSLTELPSNSSIAAAIT